MHGRARGRAPLAGAVRACAGRMALRGRFTGPAAARRSGAATGAPGGRCGRGWAAAGLAPGARLAPPCRCARPGQAMEDAGRAAAGCRRGAIRAHAAHTPCMHAYPGAGAPGRAEQVLRGRMLAGRMQRYWGACAAAPPHAVPALDMRMRCSSSASGASASHAHAVDRGQLDGPRAAAWAPGQLSGSREAPGPPLRAVQRPGAGQPGAASGQLRSPPDRAPGQLVTAGRLSCRSEP